MTFKKRRRHIWDTVRPNAPHFGAEGQPKRSFIDVLHQGAQVVEHERIKQRNDEMWGDYKTAKAERENKLLMDSRPNVSIYQPRKSMSISMSR